MPEKIEHAMSSPDPEIKGIIFDLDGTLYRMQWFLKALITVRLFPHCLRMPKFLSVRDRFSGKDMGSGEALMREIAHGLSLCVSGSTPESMQKWIRTAFYRQFVAVMPLMKGARPGMQEMLLHARKKGLKLGVLSDYEQIEQRMRGLGISPGFFDTIASSELAGALKPCPRPLLEMAASWSIDPHSICVVGDRADTDGLAAERAGMKFMRISDKAPVPAGSFSWKDISRKISSLSC